MPGNDLTGAIWAADIKVTCDDPTPIASLTVVPDAEDTSSVWVILDKATSAALSAVPKAVWDLQITQETLNEGTSVRTLMTGVVTVTPDVSRP